MITHIYAKGFKGLDFEQSLGARTLVIGRVGSGKSARALALALLVTGGLPGTGIAKNNAEILNAVGSGDTLAVGIAVNGKRLERIYKRKKGGTVGCDYRIDGEPTPKNLFDLELSKLGIGIADVHAFLSLSDAKQVDELFRLFPPAGDMRKISASINAAKAEISRLESDIRAKEQSAQSIIASISEMQLPAGSLPEVQAEIAKLEREHQDARDEVTREKARMEQEAKAAQQVESAAAKSAEQTHTPAARPAGSLLAISTPRTTPSNTPPQASHVVQRDSGDSQDGIAALKRVLSALERAGCGTCAARMILKRELKMLEVVNA